METKQAEVVTGGGLTPAAKLALLGLGAFIVLAALAVGVPRAVIEKDGTPEPAPPRPDDDAPPDDHNGGHHEVTAEMVEAAEREKAEKLKAAAPAPEKPEA